MKYIAETAALVAALSATGAQAAPSQNDKLFNSPRLLTLPYDGNPAFYADPKSFQGGRFASKRDAFIDNQPKVIPHPGGIEAATADARRLYPEIYQRDAQGFGLEDFLGLPATSVNPHFGSTGTFGKRSAEAFIDNHPKVISGPNDWAEARRLYPEIFQRDESKSSKPFAGFRRSREPPRLPLLTDPAGPNLPNLGARDRRSPFQLQQRDAVADPFLGDIMKLVGMAIDKTTKRDAVADPFFADIVKLIGTGIDKATKRDAAADPFFADIAKLIGMGIDKATKRDAVADPFLGDIMKLGGMVIDKTT